MIPTTQESSTAMSGGGGGGSGSGSGSGGGSVVGSAGTTIRRDAARGMGGDFVFMNSIYFDEYKIIEKADPFLDYYHSPMFMFEQGTTFSPSFLYNKRTTTTANNNNNNNNSSSNIGNDGFSGGKNESNANNNPYGHSGLSSQFGNYSMDKGLNYTFGILGQLANALKKLNQYYLGQSHDTNENPHSQSQSHSHSHPAPQHHYSEDLTDTHQIKNRNKKNDGDGDGGGEGEGEGKGKGKGKGKGETANKGVQGWKPLLYKTYINSSTPVIHYCDVLTEYYSFCGACRNSAGSGPQEQPKLLAPNTTSKATMNTATTTATTTANSTNISTSVATMPLINTCVYDLQLDHLILNQDLSIYIDTVNTPIFSKSFLASTSPSVAPVTPTGSESTYFSFMNINMNIMGGSSATNTTATTATSATSSPMPPTPVNSSNTRGTRGDRTGKQLLSINTYLYTSPTECLLDCAIGEQSSVW
ncbi:hypothetical protein AX774_g5976 [Zancudomyces culisetae]|uniref:Uncharacterized protein n=1 Tax=Zancudomyces culisetae TaxID=1213189 RepID=A0A1R1PI03_ZANCU|nr:hypothetical protein AX774_g5976 [Zancudomyces culisetae]|eukprot:OMH80578.1 hypothetical protein AX774_g5976 [Zancudomyces culisetae]